MKIYMIKKFLIIAALITFIFAGCAFADIDLGEGYHLPENFSSVLITKSDGTAIQNAVNNIKDGGTINLSGNFKLTQSINIKKNLTIKGVGSSRAVLNVQSKDRVIDCEGDITFENLTITRGMTARGGAVRIRGGSIKIINCEFYNNFGLGTGSILSNAKTLTLISCDIHHNQGGLMGGGVIISDGNVTMTDCSITNNRAAVCGGGICASKSDITMKNCKVTDNGSSLAGTGVKLIKGTKLTAINCDISNNYLWRSGEAVEKIFSADIDCNGDSTYIELKEEAK